MDDNALNQIVSIKHYRPFRHNAMGEDQPEEEVYFDKKRRMIKDKPVNIHRVIALKKQYKQQIKDRMDMVTKVE